MSIVSIGQFKINYLKKNYSQLARQGSEQWLTGRLTRFGGSEIGRVTKTKKSCSKLIINKLEQKFQSNIYCWWGHTFERIAKVYLEKVKNLKIYEFGAIPSTNYPVAYSPDGVYIDLVHKDLMLLEIKCPFLRDVTNETEIKSDYMMQVQTGMQILPCTKTSFLQFKFRKCSLDDLSKTGKYNRYFHRENKRSPEQTELWYGAIYWDIKIGIKYGIEQKIKPTKIYYSFKDDVEKICESFNTGVIMYFKCFFILENIIPKDKDYEERYGNVIWEKYNDLIVEYKKSKQNKKENTKKKK